MTLKSHLHTYFEMNWKKTRHKWKQNCFDRFLILEYKFPTGNLYLCFGTTVVRYRRGSTMLQDCSMSPSISSPPLLYKLWDTTWGKYVRKDLNTNQESHDDKIWSGYGAWGPYSCFSALGRLWRVFGPCSCSSVLDVNVMRVGAVQFF